MKIISFYNHKGGVGKTTLSIHLAKKLSEKYNVLVLELDDQANVLINTGEEKSYQKLIEDEKIFPLGVRSLMPSMSITNFIYKDYKYFDIIVNNDLSSLEASLKENFFKNIFDELEEQNYDYIITDNPPSKYQTVLQALNYSSDILIPFDCEDSGTKAVLDTLTLFAKEGIDFDTVKGIIPNKYLHFHKAIHDENIKTIEEAVNFEGSSIKVYQKINNSKKYKDVERSSEYTELLSDVFNDIVE